MAVLKDLIVHGPSRFINGINANSIKADEGIFNQLIAVDLKATDATIENLTATNARVTQTLTANHISTNTWEATNIANIGGNFYISPTGEQSGSINVTIDRTAAPGTDGGTYTLTFGVPSGSSGGFGVSSTSAAYWSTSAKVMATGEVSYNNSKRYPLGTCSGTISGNVTASNNNITAIIIAGVKSEALDVLFADMGIAITASSGSLAGCVGYKLKISLYERYNSAYYPIGILLTSLGRNDKKQYIDIYGGSVKSGRNAADTADLNTGMAEPVVRIGELEGLPNIVDNGGSDTLPSGWGIYTTNGFFKGKIVSNAGKIGGWTLGASAIYNNTNSKTSTTAGTYLGTDAIRNYNSSTQYVHIENGKITAQGASITGTIEATSFVAKDYYNSTYRTRVTVTTNGLTVYDGNGTANSNIQAQFGSTVQVGKKTVGYVSITSSGMDIYAGSSNKNLAHFGYETVNTTEQGGTQASGVAPYYTLGTRKTVSSSSTDIGQYSVAEGLSTTASGAYSHAEGISAVASDFASHAEGDGTASGGYSHAEGSSTVASGDYSHAEGIFTTASGWYSHSEGANTTASGNESHTEGTGTVASGAWSHAGGQDTNAEHVGAFVHGRNLTTAAEYQTIFGKYSNAGFTHAFVIGDGKDSDNLSNAFAVSRFGGDLYVRGDIYIGCNADSSGGTLLRPGSSSAVTGVKGSSESTYRTGQVSLSAANVGALATSGGTLTGCLRIKPTSDSNWSEGIRIYPASNGWTTLVLGGADNTTDTGTSANSWSLHSYNGNFYLARNGSSTSSSAILSCVNNVWAWNGTAQGNISGNAGTCSYPAGFSSRTTGATWGNTIGTSFTSWNDPTGGSIDFRQDNPSSGKVSIKVDGRFYYNEGNTPVWGLTSANGYWGMTDPDGSTASNCWIRTTQAGIIPYESGGVGSGHQYLGTASWYFSAAYVDNIYSVNGTYNGNMTIGGITRVNNALYCDIFYTGAGVVNGNLSLGGTLYQSSDRRLKKHVDYLTDEASSAFIRNLKPAHYIKDGQSQVGFYAQDVEATDFWKSMTKKDDKGYLSLNYSEIIAPLVSYCQSLEKRIEELEAKI